MEDLEGSHVTLLSSTAGRLVEDLVGEVGVVVLVGEVEDTLVEMCHSLTTKNTMAKVARHSSVTQQETHISSQV